MKKLTRETRINAVVFKDNQTDKVVMSKNLNMLFGEYLQRCKTPLTSLDRSNNQTVPTSINKMLDVEYLEGSSEADSEWNFTVYKYKDDRFTMSFVELEKN